MEFTAILLEYNLQQQNTVNLVIPHHTIQQHSDRAKLCQDH